MNIKRMFHLSPAPHLRLFVFDGVGEHADAGEFDFDLVAGLHEDRGFAGFADAAGGAGGDDVTWAQREDG